MGQGCNTNCNVFTKKIPDTGVSYTGPAIPALGICKNDTLSEVEAVILQRIINYATGVGISIPDIDLSTCALFTADLTCCDTCTDLPCLLEAYKTGLCTLYGSVTALEDALEELTTTTYLAPCLGLTNPTLIELIQPLLTDYCTLKATVTALSTTVSTLSSTLTTTIGSFLLSAISSCSGSASITKTGTGATAAIAFNGFVPIGAVIPWKPRPDVGAGLSNFDSDGVGLANSPMCGFALAQGQTITLPSGGSYTVTNMIGLSPIGTTSMTGTAPIANPGGSAYDLAANNVKGEYNHTLTGGESSMPSHTHGVLDGGHDHVIRFNNRQSDLQGASGTDNYVDFIGTNISGTDAGAAGPAYGPAAHTPQSSYGVPGGLTGGTGPSTTGITIAAVGGSSATGHMTMHPVRAMYFIERIY